MTPQSNPLSRPAWIETDGDLSQMRSDIYAAEASGAIGVDTEFFRERTFYPKLGLVQISHGERIWLVDPLAIEDLDPLVEMMTSPRWIKIFHSCREDLEVLEHHLGIVPRPIFDTQMAAAFAGYGFSLGYRGLVDDFFGVELPKGETRSDWLQRPLSSAQLRYAAQDVAFLPSAHDRLRAELEEHGRLSWLQEDIDRLLADVEQPPADDRLYLKIGRAQQLGLRQLAALRDLVAWREEEARRRDLPRNFVVKENVLSLLAARMPKKRRDLEDVDGLGKRGVERYGDAILRLIDDARRLPSEDLPAKVHRPFNLASHKAEVKTARAVAQRIAKTLDLPPELLANRRTLENTVRRWLEGIEPVLPKSLKGWRAEQLGEPLLAELRSAKA